MLVTKLLEFHNLDTFRVIYEKFDKDITALKCESLSELRKFIMEMITGEVRSKSKCDYDSIIDELSHRIPKLKELVGIQSPSMDCNAVIKAFLENQIVFGESSSYQILKAFGEFLEQSELPSKQYHYRIVKHDAFLALKYREQEHIITLFWDAEDNMVDTTSLNLNVDSNAESLFNNRAILRKFESISSLLNRFNQKYQ